MSVASAMALALLHVASSCAFMAPLPSPCRSFEASSTRLHSRVAAGQMLRMSAETAHVEARRNFLRSALALHLALTVGVAQRGSAEVFFDTERYGDKELKVSTINKVKQQFRALYEKKPELLVPLFRLALEDALSFDAETRENGPDGSVLGRVGGPGGEYLKEAAEEVRRIKSELTRQTQLTAADIIAFGGAVAIEATGGPRIVVQLGRADGNKSSKSGMSSWDFSAPTAEGILAAMTKSGLTAKEAVLLAGAIGSLNQAGQNMKEAIANKVVCDVEDPSCTSEEEGYYGLYSPVTIRSETSNLYGKNRGASAVNSNTGFDSARIAGLAGDAKFSNKFLVDAASGKSDDPLAKALMSDKEMSKWVMEYGKKGNNNKFIKDCEKCYVALTELGRSNTSR